MTNQAKRLRMLRTCVLLLAGILLGVVGDWSVVKAQREPWDTESSTFVTKEIRFDESETNKSTPTIPREWRFVGASNGEKANSSNLWFEGKDGTVYLIQGFTSNRRFILHPVSGKLGRSQK